MGKEDAVDTKGFRVYDPKKDIIVNEKHSEFSAQVDPVAFVEVEFPEGIEEVQARVAERKPVKSKVMTKESGGFERSKNDG